MNAPLHATLHQVHRLAESVALACDRIAPTWPLDRFIAVNPYWGWRQRPVAEAAAELGVLGGSRLTMPREWFRAQWDAGRLRREHLRAAIARNAASTSVEELVAALHAPSPAPGRLPLLTDLRDAAGDRPAGTSWVEQVTHQISQHCAAHFDREQARWRLPDGDTLYGGWRHHLAADRGLAWRRGRRWLAGRLDEMPGDDPHALLAPALAALGIPESGHAAYLTALLLSVNGWAAWCAHERWQARLAGRDDEQILHLLAIRLAWEWLLKDDAAGTLAGPDWAASWAGADEQAARLAAAQRLDWLLQDALEFAYQGPLCEALARPPASDAGPPPLVQAVFCIDVRSEVFRRALEASSPAVRTRGFAGFFGLPIAYSPAGSEMTRPQLPGLLAPALSVDETEGSPSLGQVLRQRRHGALQWRRRWTELRAAAASGFSFVESCGLLYGAKLLRDSLPSTAAPARWEDTGLPSAARGARPRLPQTRQDPAAAARLAAGILRTMGLTRDFAPLVLLVGHGSQSTNNPHAAGLDCGACGGQTGEVNARALADLLNTPAVRQALAVQGIRIPDGTHFLPALHNTTTDEVRLFDTEAVPAAAREDLARLRAWLAQAGDRARAERAAALGLQAQRPEALADALRRRANDWAQVRPEWGLADNAAFIVAPRDRTRHLVLDGRAFLHDHDWRDDPDGETLERIMTAPMVVTNWINLQYHASAVDNRRYGSGNKLLHNVVAGRIGVFEGNGGDLRIGLPLQSVHDGRSLRHTPLRLSVFIEAPRAAIEAVLAKHAVVRDLVGHGWLHLFRIDPERPVVEQHGRGGWQERAGVARDGGG